MDSLPSIMLSWQFIFLSLAIMAAVSMVRDVVEYLMQRSGIDPAKPLFWNEVVLPILPLLVGVAGIEVFKGFSYPEVLVTNSDRLVFGLVAGLLSGLVYRVVKALMYQKLTDMAKSLQTTNIVQNTNENNLPARGRLS